VTSNDKEMRRVRALARALDSAVAIPGTSIRIGLDPILGLIPGAGDVAGAALAGYIVLVATRAGAPSEVVWRMLGNVAVDAFVGTFPVVGDLFDVAFKSNMRNVELLERYTTQPAAVTKSSRRLGFLVILIILLLLVALGAGAFLVGRLLWQLLSG
jgi:uncharacterized protein DUF4112